MALASSFYRFYPMRAEGRIADRHEVYFADDAAAIQAAPHMIEDFPRLEIWCGTRKVASFTREELVRPPLPHLTWAVVLINRNKRLLHQAAQARGRSEALRARAADLVSSSAVLRLLHRHSVAVSEGSRCRLQGGGSGFQFQGELSQPGDGLLIKHVADETPNTGSAILRRPAAASA